MVQAKKQLLLIEDDMALAELVCDFLRAEGFAVTHAADAKQAIASCQQTHFDLIICDLMLPDLHGFKLAQRIHADQHCPLIFLTALGDDDTHVKGLELGAVDFITKPVKPAILLARINTNLAKQPVFEPSSSVQFGPYFFQDRGKVLTRNGIVVPLTNQEYDVLRTLVRYSDGPISRDFMFQQLVGRPYDGSDRAADLQISRLRKKLDSCGCVDLSVRTLRGKGYILVLTADA